MHPRNVACFLIATLALAGHAHASCAASHAPGDPPAPADAMDAFAMVDRWVRAWDVPVDPGEDVQTDLPIPGASVTLRLDGEVIGRGEDHEGDRKTLWRATFDAVAEANRRLPVENDVLRGERSRAIAERVTISMELAGEPVARGFESYLDVELRVAPGIEGVAMRMSTAGASSARTEYAYPGRMLASGTLPPGDVGSLLSKMTGEPNAGLMALGDALTRYGASLRTFRTVHLAQPGPGMAPVFLYRGGTVVPQQAITAREIRAMADRVADHLMSRKWPGPEPYGLLGTYDALTNLWDPPIASPVEQAVVGIALMRYARMPGLDVSRSARATDAASAVLLSLARVGKEEPNPASDLVSAAAVIVLVHEFPPALLPKDRDLEQLRGACALTITKVFDTQRGFDASIPAASRGLLALAAVAFAESVVEGGAASQEEQDRVTAMAERVVGSVFVDTERGQLVNQMPWLGMAALRLSPLKGTDEVTGGGALRDMRDLVWEFQMSDADVTDDAMDLAGGIVFNASRSPLPSWQTARPIAFLSMMVGRLALTDPGEAPLELARVLGAIRFLRQLECDQGTAWMERTPARAAGGIRASLWQQTLPPDASSLTLIGLAETVSSMDRMTRR